MMKNYYSTFLVFLQFLLIFILVIINNSIFNSIFSLIISFFGFLLGCITLYFNNINNFNIKPEIKKGAKLIIKGPYSYIRHPMYTSIFLVMFGIISTEFNFISIILYIILNYVLFLKAKREEKLCLIEYAKYFEYKKKSKMFIPFLF